MTNDSKAREQRAANRRRRRGAPAGSEQADGDAQIPNLQEALKAAASAAAVGAAVGAARAYSSRRGDGDGDETPSADRSDEERDDRAAGDDELEASAPQGAEQERRPADEEEPEPAPEPERRPAPPERERQGEPVPASELRSIVETARRVLRDLQGADAESVSSVRRGGGGWVVGLEVVEVRRIPDSTDVLATYEVELDGDGAVLRFERVRRYHRSEADRGGRG
ncbi:MAG TPA: gas vesicle protein GvpO [Gaiellaceae bacterium]|nr:gas vesicle protein GvpO [Gaiellaceae bacterium]